MESRFRTAFAALGAARSLPYGCGGGQSATPNDADGLSALSAASTTATPTDPRPLLVP